MSTSRPHVSLTMKLAALLKQARCPRCGGTLSEPIHWDHGDFHALGGETSADNLWAMHADCHRAQTVGNHVPLSGDLSKIAKAKRLNKKHEEFRQRLLRLVTKETKQYNRWPKRKFNKRP